MKFDITVDGGHKAEVNIELDQQGTFSGSVISTEYGTGQITNGRPVGAALVGNVSLGGYNADFSAQIAGSNISGRLKYGWFFDKSFAGAQIV